jgi:hypothetical protein
LTGDTVTFGKGAWGDAKNATIMLVFILPDSYLQRQLFLLYFQNYYSEQMSDICLVLDAHKFSQGGEVGQSHETLVFMPLSNIGDKSALIYSQKGRA